MEFLWLPPHPVNNEPSLAFMCIHQFLLPISTKGIHMFFYKKLSSGNKYSVSYENGFFSSTQFLRGFLSERDWCDFRAKI